MMVEPRYTSVMRSTRSGNYYNVPLSADSIAGRDIAPEVSSNYDGFEFEAVAAAWGTTTMRRLPSVAKHRELNAAPSKDLHAFQPAFAFDLNKLVASLTKGSASSSHNSSFTSTRSGVAEPMAEPMPESSRISIMPKDVSVPRQRGRRGALSGEEELARSYVGAATSPENSIITYSLNKRKQKRLAAKALAAASVNGANFEVAVADAGNEHQPQYVPRYVPEYQSDVAPFLSSRNREPSLDQQSYAL